jgi:hypothetical protein
MDCLQAGFQKGERRSRVSAERRNLPSLEPLETSEQIQRVSINHPRYGAIDHDSLQPATPLESHHRHAAWAEDRRRVYDALMATHEPNRRLDAFANCGSALFLSRDGDDLALTSNHCHDRLCVPCQTARRAMLVANVQEAIANSKQVVRFCTLTLRARECKLSDQLTRLTESFKSLRRRKFWKETITGGAFFIEVKLGKTSKAWHVHAHCLLEGKFLDQRTLSEEWHAVTGDSYIVDVRKIDDPARRASYVTKYATKPADTTVLSSPDHLQEFVVSIKGRRLFQCFGTWKAFALEAEHEPRRNLTVIGSIEHLAKEAARGEPTAARWYYAAVRKWPVLAETFGVPPGGMPPDTPPPTR